MFLSLPKIKALSQLMNDDVCLSTEGILFFFEMLYPNHAANLSREHLPCMPETEFGCDTADTSIKQH